MIILSGEQMTLENLDEYILEFQNYREGNYDYGTLTTKNDITKAIENGKKIVFLRYNRSFMVLGQEGIVYKLVGGSVNGFKWENISLEVSSFMQIKIHILMPNGDFIIITPGYYYSKEFPKLKPRKKFDLHKYTFIHYYTFRKFEEHEIKYEEDKLEVKNDLTRVENTKVVNYTSLADLKKEYSKYREKKYKFGKYGTAEQIQKEFLKRKIFILKGGMNDFDWVITFFLFIIGFVPGIYLWIYNIWYGISVFCFWAIFQSFFCAKFGHLLIISPSGFYYRKILSSGFYYWNQVTHIKENTMDAIDAPPGGMVTIFISLERTIKLRSNYYLNKEFSKKVDIEMFFTLFHIYSHQGEKPSYIQEMKGQLISSDRISGTSKLNTKDVRKTQINSDKKVERSKITSDTQSPKFPPISELFKELRFPKKERGEKKQ